MKAFVLVPTYVIYLVLRRWFPPTHPWYRRNITYDVWCQGASPICVDLGVGMTLSWFGLVVAVGVWL